MENFNEEERACLCALNRIFGFEPKIGKGLLDAFGGPTAVFKAKSNEISDFLGSLARSRYSPLVTGSAFESAAIELEKLARDGSAKMVTLKLCLNAKTRHWGYITKVTLRPRRSLTKGPKSP